MPKTQTQVSEETTQRVVMNETSQGINDGTQKISKF